MARDTPINFAMKIAHAFILIASTSAVRLRPFSSAEENRFALHNGYMPDRQQKIKAIAAILSTAVFNTAVTKLRSIVDTAHDGQRKWTKEDQRLASEDDVDAELDKALIMNFPIDAQALGGLPPDLMAACDFNARFHDDSRGLIAHREHCERVCAEVASLVDPLNVELRCIAPRHVLALHTDCNWAFMACVEQSIRWPYPLHVDYILGHHVVGSPPYSGIYPRLPKPNTIELSKLHVPGFNKKLHDEVEEAGLRSKNAARNEDVWKRIKLEIERKTVLGDVSESVGRVFTWSEICEFFGGR